MNVVSSDSRKDRSNRGCSAGGESDYPGTFLGVEVEGCTALTVSVLTSVVEVETFAWHAAQLEYEYTKH